jgi:hypothetical protein
MKQYVIRTGQYIQALSALKAQGIEGFDLESSGALWCTATLTEQQKEVLIHSGLLLREFDQ